MGHSGSGADFTDSRPFIAAISRGSNVQKSFIAGVSIAALLEIVIVMIPGIPLGIPSEWTWARHERPTDVMSALGQCLPGAFGFLTLGFVALGGASLFNRHRLTCEADKTKVRRGLPFRITIALLLGLAAASFVWIKACQLCAPAPYGELKPRRVLYDPGASGYFYEAAFQMGSVSEFLQGYEARMAKGDVLHEGTHPPGLYLLSRGLINLCDSVPFIVSKSQKYSDKQALRAFLDLNLEPSLTKPQLTALRLLGDITALLAALTVIPLYYLVRRCFDAAVAWRSVCVFTTFCCISVFFPKSDVMFTFTSTSALVLGVFALDGRAGKLGYYALAAACGLVLWLGLFLSLAHLAVLALLLVFGAARTYRKMRSVRSGSRTKPGTILTRQLGTVAVLLGTIAVVTTVWSMFTGCDLWSVWRMNLQNHAAFYDQYPRTAWKWLAVNPLELSLAVGLPVALTVVSGATLCRQRAKTESAKNGGTLVRDLTVSIIATVGLLWLSCRNNGESARLWCFLTPWLLIMTAQVIRQEVRSRPGKVSSPVWITLMVAQMIVTIAVCARVNGFPMPGTN